VSSVVVRDRTCLQQILINSYKSYSVTTRHISNRFNGSTHHKDSSLDVLFVEIVFASWSIVGTHNSYLKAGGDGSREDSSESEESTLVSGRHHLRHVHHQRTIGVAVYNALTTLVINRSSV